MSTNSVNMSSMLRMSGLASGLDTESIVSSLMKVEQMKLDKLAKQKTRMDWQSEKNLEVNNLLRAFRDKYLSVTSADNVFAASSLLANKVTMESSTSLKVSASNGAAQGTHTVDFITSIATGANAASGSAVSADMLSTGTELGSLALNTTLDFSGGPISFKINGQTFSFESTATLGDMIRQVNADETANVTMSYSQLTGKFSIQNDDLGADSSLTIENLSGNAFGAGSAFGIDATTYTNGTDAVLRIDGIDVTRDTNSFTIDGITYKLTGTTGTAQQFYVEQDVDGTVKKIKAFVDAYNELYTKLDGMVSEHKDYDYEPLTEAQKEEMTDKQIEQWEAKAKQGILANDSYINGLLSTMRSSFYQKVEDAGINANAIGFSTASYLTKGVINLDETKLRTALTTNPDQVATLFTEVSDSTDAKTAFAENGLAVRIRDGINKYVNDSNGYRKESFDDQYDDLEDRIDRMEDLIVQREQRYWNQYTALETAIAKMNAQSNWLSSMLNPSSGN